MYMIAYSTYLYYFAACGINQLSYIGMNAVEIAFTDRRARGFDVKYQMYVCCLVFIPRVSLRLPRAMRLLGFQPVFYRLHLSNSSKLDCIRVVR